MALTNCTISSITLNPTVGSALGSQTGTLTITPSTGYVVAASAFTNNTNLNAVDSDGNLTYTSQAIQSIGSATDTGTPSTSGNTVTFLVTFKSGFIMPSSNLTLEVDIDGAATQEVIAVSGKFNMINSNSSITVAGYNSGSGSITNAASDPHYIGGSWSNTGNEGTTETVLTITCTVSTNYTFENNEPSVELSSTDNFTVTKTGSGSDPRVFTVAYKYPSSASSNNEVTIYSNPVYSPTVATSIKGFTFNNNPINSKGRVVDVFIYGSEGATYNLNVAKDQTTATYGLPLDNSVVTHLHNASNVRIDNKGFAIEDVVVPSSSTSETIVFTLTGSTIDSSIVTHHSSAVFTIEQTSKVSFTLATEERGGSTFNAVADIVLGTGEFDQITTQKVDGTVGDAFTDVDVAVVSAAGNNIFAKVNPVYAAKLITGRNVGGWNVTITGATFTGLGSSSVKVTISGRIEEYGNESTAGVLNLANVFKDNSGADTAIRNELTTNYSIDTTAHTNFPDASKASFVVGDTLNGWAGSEPTAVYHFYDNAATDADKLALTSGKYYKFKIGAWNGAEVHYIGLAAATNTLTEIVQIT